MNFDYITVDNIFYKIKHLLKQIKYLCLRQTVFFSHQEERRNSFSTKNKAFLKPVTFALRFHYELSSWRCDYSNVPLPQHTESLPVGYTVSKV